MNIEGYNFPDDLLYDKKHFWSKIDGNVLTMGMTEYATKTAGDLVFVEIIEPGRNVSQEKAFMSVESGKWVGRVYAPVSGEVIELNEELEFEPTIVNEDPYGEGWLAKIEISDKEELNKLLSVENLAEWLVPEIKRLKKLQAKKG